MQKNCARNADILQQGWLLGCLVQPDKDLVASETWSIKVEETLSF